MFFFHISYFFINRNGSPPTSSSSHLTPSCSPPLPHVFSFFIFSFALSFSPSPSPSRSFYYRRSTICSLSLSHTYLCSPSLFLDPFDFVRASFRQHTPVRINLHTSNTTLLPPFSILPCSFFLGLKYQKFVCSTPSPAFVLRPFCSMTYFLGSPSRISTLSINGSNNNSRVNCRSPRATCHQFLFPRYFSRPFLTTRRSPFLSKGISMSLV